ncbi:YuiB family protein [Exiguobacterium flavidum]|uniref:YuiB family protein n=1 Tax=Exiguobacterium flavidum TaxID=2184695 RepID=UPI000DF74743|nr:YuiB family protein [Exiguobacterium flavidum]
MHIIQAVIGSVLYLVMFFSIGFILNMLLRSTWIMLVVYPVIIIMMIDNQSTIDYITKSSTAFANLGDRFSGLQTADVLMFTAGLLGIVAAGLSIRFLRKSGYQMF